MKEGVRTFIVKFTPFLIKIKIYLPFYKRKSINGRP